MLEQVAAAVHPEQSLEEQVDSALDAYVAGVTAQPALYQSFVHELPSLGRAGADRLLAVNERFAELLVRLVDAAPAAVRALPMDTAIMIVGGLRELVVTYLYRARDVQELRAAAGQTIKVVLAAAVL
jgi:hypothetical protein